MFIIMINYMVNNKMNQNKKVIIFGPGDLGQVVYSYLKEDSDFEIVAFTAHKNKIEKEKLFDLPIIPYEEIEKTHPPEKFSMFIAIPYTKINQTRATIYADVKTKGYELISYVNSNALIWNNVKIGDNCFILENNVIQPFVEIGNNVIIWSGNHIGHHSNIKDHCFISSHVVISGKVTIEPYCFLGVNATIRDGLTIEEKCVIGAGCIILKNTKKSEVYKSKHAKKSLRTSDEL
jgi:sugar O-acyltransferase (sialic acid O-acetyltransferase NeuD family)